MARALKTLIAEDEQIGRKVLREELERLPEIRVIGEAEDGADALRQIRELEPDLVFLDLNMPLMNGLDVVGNLSGSRLPVIVIVTAYHEHAIEAFEAGAIDYLLKPVGAERLQRAVDRARSLLDKPLEVVEKIAKIASLDKAAAPRKLVGRVGRDYFLVDQEDVLAVQVERELVWLVTAERRLLCNQALRVVESGLRNSSFERVHRNALVNVNHVRKISPLVSRRWILTLSNELQVVVRKRQAHNIRRILESQAEVRS